MCPSISFHSTFLIDICCLRRDLNPPANTHKTRFRGRYFSTLVISYRNHRFGCVEMNHRSLLLIAGSQAVQKSYISPTDLHLPLIECICWYKIPGHEKISQIFSNGRGDEMEKGALLTSLTNSDF